MPLILQTPIFQRPRYSNISQPYESFASDLSMKKWTMSACRAEFFRREHREFDVTPFQALVDKGNLGINLTPPRLKKRKLRMKDLIAQDRRPADPARYDRMPAGGAAKRIAYAGDHG